MPLFNNTLTDTEAKPPAYFSSQAGAVVDGAESKLLQKANVDALRAALEVDGVVKIRQLHSPEILAKLSQYNYDLCKALDAQTGEWAHLMTPGELGEVMTASGDLRVRLASLPALLRLSFGHLERADEMNPLLLPPFVLHQGVGQGGCRCSLCCCLRCCLAPDIGSSPPLRCRSLLQSLDTHLGQHNSLFSEVPVRLGHGKVVFLQYELRSQTRRRDSRV